MTEKIEKMIEAMTTDEMKQRLAEYMAADQQLAPRPVAVEVRPSNINNVRCRYDVLLIAENGQEAEVKFRDRYSRLVYIYTLLHPQGYQRRLAAANNYRRLLRAQTSTTSSVITLPNRATPSVRLRLMPLTLPLTVRSRTTVRCLSHS